MSQRRGIAGAGNWIIDHVKIINGFPQEEHLVVIEEEALGTGGAPYNVLVGLATLDPSLPLEAIGVVGDDADGEYILGHLKRLGIGSTAMRKTSQVPTSYTDVMTVRPTGKRTFFHNLGANALLDEQDFDFGKIQARILHLGYLMLLKALDSPAPGDSSLTRAARVLSRAQQAGLSTSLDIVTDLSPRIHQVVRPALPFTDHLITNELEAAAVAGIEVRDKKGKLLPEVLPQIAQRLFDLGVRRDVVIHAPELGYWRRSDGTEVLVRSLKVPQTWIKGTAGAGDAFCTGVLYGLHEGWGPEECLKLAAANAAQSLSDPTTTGGLRPLKETLELVERFGFRHDSVNV